MDRLAHTIRTPPRAAFGLLTSILVTLLASSSAPTPLYATHQARWGFSPVAVTVGLFLVQTAGVRRTVETSRRVPGAVRSLRPTLALP